MLEDGADADVIEAGVAHTKTSRRAFDGYVRSQQWAKTCAEVAKLKLTRKAGLATSLATVVDLSSRKMVEAAGVEISWDVNETERLLHIQELGVPGDPTVSAVI